MNSKRHGNEETWSRGANSGLPLCLISLVLQRHCGIMEACEDFFYLENRASRSALSYSCTKLANRDFVSNFAERIENCTLWFY